MKRGHRHVHKKNARVPGQQQRDCRAPALVMRRAAGAREHLDGRVPPADLAATLADLDRLNAWFGGHALSLARVRRVAAVTSRARTLRVVDVGGGDGAFPTSSLTMDRRTCSFMSLQ